MKKLLLLIGAMLILSACSSGLSESDADATAQAAVAEALASVPTSTPAPTIAVTVVQMETAIVTQIVEVTREVPVVEEVEVTRVVQVPVTAEPTPEPTATPIPEAGEIPADTVGVVESVSFVTEYATYIVGTIGNGTDEMAEFVKIVATLYDDEGQFAGTDYTYMMPELILPGGIVPFSIGVSEAPEFASYDLAVEFDATGDMDDTYRALEIGETVAEMTRFAYVISGIVTNTGDETAEYVQIMAVLYDSEGNIVATDYTYATLDEIGPGAISPFELNVTNLASEDVAEYWLMVEGSIQD